MLKLDGTLTTEKGRMYICRNIGIPFEEYEEMENVASKIENWNDYQFSIPNLIQIPKSSGKTRDIYVYERGDNTIQKMIQYILYENFQYLNSPNCYSYRRGTTVDQVINKLARQSLGKWVVKVDIVKYFESVKTKYLLEFTEFLSTLNYDNIMYGLLEGFWKDDRRYHLGKIEQYNVSLKPGSPISAFVSNLLLREVDYHLSEITKDNYFRYADDIVIIADTEEQVYEYLNELEIQLDKFELKISKEKTKIYNPKEPIEYLGVEIDRDSGIRSITKNKYKERQKALSQIIRNNRQYRHISPKYALYKAIIEVNEYLAKPTKYGYTNIGHLFMKFNNKFQYQELDYYIRDTLRKLYTGNHNKGNIKKLTNKELKSLGLISIQDTYSDYLYNPHIWKSRLSMHYLNKSGFLNNKLIEEE